jgi:membrane-associated phospholipid phosphatase
MQLEMIKGIQSISNPFFDVFFQGLTFFGEEYVAILIGAGLLWCINARKGYEYAYMLLTGLLINVTLKEIFDVSRPIGVEGVRSLRVETATGKSFPSGHTQTVTMVFWWLRNQIQKPVFTGASIIVIMGVAVSRLYLGVHWPLDVGAAVVIGIGWVVFMQNMYPKIEDQLMQRGLLLLVAAWMGVFFFYSEDYMKLLGLLTGLTLSMIANQKWIQYQPKGSVFYKGIMLILGVIGVGVILVAGKQVFVHALFGDLLRYMTMMIWVGTGIPLLSKKLKRRRKI